jgi:hypothetical protein
MKFHRVTEDSNMFDAKGRQVLSANSKGTTIMMVCEVGDEATA